MWLDVVGDGKELPPNNKTLSSGRGLDIVFNTSEWAEVIGSYRIATLRQVSALAE